LLGRDGNAFAIMGACAAAAEKAGWTRGQVRIVLDEMKADDYDHLLRTAMTYFEVS
jgi:hypothetical protein